MGLVDKNEFRTVKLTENFMGSSITITLAEHWQYQDKNAFNRDLEPVVKRFLYSSTTQKSFDDLVYNVDLFLMHQKSEGKIYYMTPALVKPVEELERVVSRNEAKEKYENAIEQYAAIANKFGIVSHDNRFISNKLASLYKKYGFWDVRVCYADNIELFNLLGTYGYGKDHTEKYYNELTDNWIYVGFKHDLMED